MKPLFPRMLAALAALATPLLFAPAASAAPFWFPDPATVWGDQVNGIYQLLTWISIGILLIVEVGLVAAIVKFRKKPGDTREPATWSHHTTLEVVWTVIPFILLIVVLVPSFKALAYLADVPKKADVTLEVVGHQFFWEYRFPDYGVKFNTTPTMGPGTGTETLHLPVGRKIKVLLTSADVIHSWYVPNFAIQQMTTPGNLAQIPLELTRTGLFEGYCTYLCGTLHGAMRIRIQGDTAADFDKWIAAQPKTTIEPIKQTGKIDMLPPPPRVHEEGKEPGKEEGKEAAVDVAALSAKGKDIFASKCAGCHQAMGTGVPGVFPPLAGSDYVNGPDEQLATTIKNGLNGPVTVKGTQYNGAMPAFKGQLSDEEIAAVATYVRTSWGNNGKPIAPAVVEAVH